MALHSIPTFQQSIGKESIFRYAPTPSGFLHLGNAANFVLTWLFARTQPGPRILLRIDDLDAARIRQEYVEDVFETLDWLGLDWDMGPSNPKDFSENWSQHHRIPHYEVFLQKLIESGLVFGCQKSRKDLAEYGERYPIEFRNQGLRLDAPDTAWRIATPDNMALSDFVIRRRDGIPAYQIASLVDDLYFGVDHIIRGKDLLPSTQAQIWLAETLGGCSKDRLNVLHHDLILDSAGKKLSKSEDSESIQHLRKKGLPRNEVFDLVLQLLSLPIKEINSPEELKQYFLSNQSQS